MAEKDGASGPRGGGDLGPLLAPRSIALVGASARPDSAGNSMLRMARLDGYRGHVVAVNPNYREIEGTPCFPRLSSLPERVDHAVLCVPNAGLEAALDEAIAHGARAATIFATCHLDGDSNPPLAARLAAKARSAGIALCGGSSMGFYNLWAGLRVAGFPSAPGIARGGIVWIAQSGSAFSALAHNDRRLKFGLCVSSGAELTTTTADYMAYALSRPETRVIGLFLESVRDPANFTAALAAAAERGIAVVVLKVGRTALSAEMARSHTGALAGDDAAYRALFRRYGVHQVNDLDEMAATLALFEQPRRAAPGGLATLHDSGGEREMLVDLAAGENIVFAKIGEATKARIAPRLDAGLRPENPLDAWGTATDFSARYVECFSALLDDPDVGAGLFVSDVRDGYWYSAGCADAAAAAAMRTDKPVAVVSNFGLTADAELAARLAAADVPVIKGSRNGLRAARHLFAHRDFAARARVAAPPAPAGTAQFWRPRMAGGVMLTEEQALALLADYGIPTPPRVAADSRAATLQAAAEIGYPVALKTANPGIPHKSDAGGVRLGMTGADVLGAAYDEMAASLGPAVLVAEMAPPGIEIGLGAIDDPAFGPFVMVAAGGILIEVMSDAAVALAPFGEDEALALLGSLRVAKLLGGVRGQPPTDMKSLAVAVSRFSVLAADLSGAYSQIDVNPIIAGPGGAVAVDALVIGKPREN